MGVSTDGIIGYGVILEEGTPSPFGDEWYEDALEDWWRMENGYKDIHEPYNDEGGYAEGWSKGDERFTEYFDHRREWLKSNPLPVQPVNYCSGDYPMWMLAVPGTVVECSRGCPTRINPTGSNGVIKESLDPYLEFIDKYLDEYKSGTGWYLMSYYG